LCKRSFARTNFLIAGKQSLAWANLIEVDVDVGLKINPTLSMAAARSSQETLGQRLRRKPMMTRQRRRTNSYMARIFELPPRKDRFRFDLRSWFR